MYQKTYKEIDFENQVGYGLTVTNPGTNTRALVGIFETFEEANECGKVRKALGRVVNPRVVKWTKQVYDKYDYVFKK